MARRRRRARSARRDRLLAEHVRCQTVESRNALVEEWYPDLMRMLGCALGRKAVVVLKQDQRPLRDEVVSAAQLALVEAADSYEPSRGAAFATWLVWCIRRHVLDTLRKETGMPRSWVDKGRRRVSLENLLHKVADEHEDDAPHGGEDVPRDVLVAEEYLTDHPRDPMEDDTLADAARLLADLSTLEVWVVCRYYFDGAFKKDIAEELGISVKEVSDIMNHALDTEKGSVS